MNKLKLFTKVFKNYKEPTNIRIKYNKKLYNKKNIDINDPDFSKQFWKNFNLK